MKYFVAVLLLAAAVFAVELKEEVKILRKEFHPKENGEFKLEVQQEDGTEVKQHGHLIKGEEGDVVAIEGTYKYVGDDGKTYTVKFVADDKGFRPVGDHFPVAPVDPHHHF